MDHSGDAGKHAAAREPVPARGLAGARRSSTFPGMAINEHWNIRGRGHSCALTGTPFAEGDPFYTALYEDAQTGEFIRRDYSAAAWTEIGGAPDAFSSWRSIYEPPKPAAKTEPVGRETAEGLLRRLMEEDLPGTVNARYILALMLERKRILKQTGSRETPDGPLLIYEHAKTGEVYLLRDPELKLDRISEVQEEVAALLAPRSGDAAPAGESPAGESSPESPPQTAAVDPAA